MGQTMTNLEQYLRSASFGTYGKTRALIRQELEANIRLRGKELEHYGLNETQAISRALEELGAASHINTGMTGVYTMPKITRAAIPAAFALTALVIALSISRAQVETTVVGTVAECDFKNTKTQTMPCALEANWLKLSSFKTELEKAGGKLEVIPDGFNLQFPGDRLVKVDGSPIGTPENQSIDFKQNWETFFPTLYVIGLIAKESNLPVKLEGLNNPHLIVGDTSIAFTGDAPVKTTVFRFMNVQTQLQSDLKNNGIKFKVTQDCTNMSMPRLFICASPGEKTHRIKVNAPEGTIFASLEKRSNKSFSIDIAAVNSDGMLEMKLASQTVYFVNDFKKLKAGQGETILLRLTNRIDARARQYEIAQLPKSLISAAK
jgi:arginine repressor